MLFSLVRIQDARTYQLYVPMRQVTAIYNLTVPILCRGQSTGGTPIRTGIDMVQDMTLMLDMDQIDTDQMGIDCLRADPLRGAVKGVQLPNKGRHQPVLKMALTPWSAGR